MCRLACNQAGQFSNMAPLPSVQLASPAPSNHSACLGQRNSSRLCCRKNGGSNGESSEARTRGISDHHTVSDVRQRRAGDRVVQEGARRARDQPARGSRRQDHACRDQDRHIACHAQRRDGGHEGPAGASADHRRRCGCTSRTAMHSSLAQSAPAAKCRCRWPISSGAIAAAPLPIPPATPGGSRRTRKI